MTYTIRSHHSPEEPAVFTKDGTVAEFDTPQQALEALVGDLEKETWHPRGDWYRAVDAQGRTAWTLVVGA